MRVEEKIQGGKLLAIEVAQESSTSRKTKITGDFFLHPEDTILLLENLLDNMDYKASETLISSKISIVLTEKSATLIGVSPNDLARLFKKALVEQ